MNMEADAQVSQLEAALIHQAETLAREQRQNAEATRTRILKEAAERRKAAEEREAVAARCEAERLVRRQVQAAEFRMAAELDRLRWALTEEILARVREAFRTVVADDRRYLAIIEAWLANAAGLLPAGDLVAEVRAADLPRLSGAWAQMIERAAPGRQVELRAHDEPCEGGIRIITADRRAQVDQTFAARQSRLASELARETMEHLFASTPNLGTLVHG
jgi:vacuolar-type H+-ATPase subunit E/Vma4